MRNKFQSLMITICVLLVLAFSTVTAQAAETKHKPTIAVSFFLDTSASTFAYRRDQIPKRNAFIQQQALVSAFASMVRASECMKPFYFQLSYWGGRSVPMLPWTLVETPADFAALAKTLASLDLIQTGGTNHLHALTQAVREQQAFGAQDKVVLMTTDQGLVAVDGLAEAVTNVSLLSGVDFVGVGMANKSTPKEWVMDSLRSVAGHKAWYVRNVEEMTGMFQTVLASRLMRPGVCIIS